MARTDIDLGRYQLGWHDVVDYAFQPKKGLSREVVEEISYLKGEPDWMRRFRLRSLEVFERKPMKPWFATNMPALDFQDIYYYLKPSGEQVSDWDMLPENIRTTYEKLGIPEAERKYLSGVTAQYECLRGDALVWTTRGMRVIKELEPGDEVFSLNEATKEIEVSSVIGTRCSGEKEVFEVTARGRTIAASANHPFLVLGDVPRWVPLEELRPSDLVATVGAPLARGEGATGSGSLAAGAPAALLERVDLRVRGAIEGAAVERIEPAGVELVYDIEVEGHHNFVAEGFVVHNSEVVFHRNREELEQLGVFFSDMDTALREHPEIVKEHLGTVIPPGDNKFAALNSAVWSGGSFIFVPEGVHVPMPLQAYFRINAENAGQFERTMIVVEEGASVHYVEGCSAPVYTTDSLHSAVVEIVAKPGARVQYTTIQNWSPNVYNLVTKRARAEDEATVVWIDGNLGSKLTMKYPSVYLVGPKAHGEVLSVAYAGQGQHQDAGAKMIHAAPETSSIIESKSISRGGGRTTYRGLVRVDEGATHVKSNVRCDALILDEDSRSDTYPYQEIAEQDVRIEHEATVSKVGEDQLFYLMSRGLSETEAASMIVNGFIEPITKTLPMEYAVELSRLIELEMEGAVG